MWILCADLTWYVLSTSMSFHLSVPVKLLLKSPRVGSPVGGGAATVASALTWSTKSVRLSMSRFVVGIPWVLFVYPFLCTSRCKIYLEKKEIMINSRWQRSLRFDKFKMAVVCACVDASPKFKTGRVDASAEFKMAVFACTDASTN